MNININLTSVNRTVYKRKRNIKYLVIHYTANNGDTAYANTCYFKQYKRGASAHYFVDERSIWQCVKENDIAWHVGARRYYNKCRNNNSIGIELCSRKDLNGRYYFKKETIENALQLTKELMEKYNIPIENVVRHYDVTRKNCPEPFVRNEFLWQDFKRRLQSDENVMANIMQDMEQKYGKEIVFKGLKRIIEATKNKNEFSAWLIGTQDEVDIKNAVKTGITDGSRPRDLITREEVMLMTLRGRDK